MVATQNPIEMEGTYPLPEAQLDRFLMKVLVDYPSDAEELAVLRQAHQGFNSHDLEAAGVRSVITPSALAGCVAAIERVHVHDAVLDYILRVVRGSRQAHGVVLGGSPRAELALLRCGKTLAALRGRDYVIPDDIEGWPLPSSATASYSAPKPSWRAFLPTAWWRTCWRRCRCRGSG